MPSVSASISLRKASLFRNGRNQAVRIPREFELPGTHVIMRKDGNQLILEPVPERNGLLDVLDSLDELSIDIPLDSISGQEEKGSG